MSFAYGHIGNLKYILQKFNRNFNIFPHLSKYTHHKELIDKMHYRTQTEYETMNKFSINN